jgi:alpha-L-fucosidase 2
MWFGTYPNLLDALPPFQIDGNFGCTAGIAEMLVQSHAGAIHILPALPDTWAAGEVSGLVTRGGFEVAITWQDKQVNQLKIKSNLGGNCRLRLDDRVQLTGPVKLAAGKGDNANPFFALPKDQAPLISPVARLNLVNVKPTRMYDFKTGAGKEYVFTLDGGR